MACSRVRPRQSAASSWVRWIDWMPAMERVYPALSSQFVLLMLASSITSQISVEELTATASLVQSDTYRSFEVYLVVAVVYLALSALYRFGFWLIGLGLFERKRRLGTPL